ncbi:heavy-metal-associated domain-containing protein [Siminovitchia fordii]|nr:heavy-metal-associated domain-containing protein [Siminovitchia fordii]
MTVYIDVANNKQAIEKLEEILLQLNGVERALVDIDDGEVKITFSEKELSHEAILSTISRNGFDILP